MANSPPRAPAPAAPAPRYSRGGLITAALLAVWSLDGLIIAARTFGEPLAPSAAFLFASAVLFWRAFRPPLTFGQGFAVWFGAGLAGFSLTAFYLPWQTGTAIFVVFVALGAAILRLGLDPPPRGWIRVLCGVAIAFIVLTVLASAFYTISRKTAPPQPAPEAAPPR